MALEESGQKKHGYVLSSLGLGDLEAVKSFPSTIKELWFGVGSYLGVKAYYLESLNDLPSDQMDMIMGWWLGGKAYVFEYFLEPCWQTLVKAIAHPAGGNDVTAANEMASSHLAPTAGT